MLTTAHLFLTFVLVAMIAAAPLAEQDNTGKAATTINGDNMIGDRTKRAKEVMTFGNQQNAARMGASQKKSVDDDLPHDDVLAQLPDQQPTDDTAEPEEIVEPLGAQEKQEDNEVVPEQEKNQASVGGHESEDNRQVGMIPVVEQGADIAGSHSAGEQETPEADTQQSEEAIADSQPTVSSEDLPGPVPDGDNEDQTDDDDDVNDVEGDKDDVGGGEQLQPAAQQDDKVNTDDVESFLKELHQAAEQEESLKGDDDDSQEDGGDDDENEEGNGGGVEGEEEEEEEGKDGGGDEGSAERELMQVTNQVEDGGQAPVADIDPRDYTQTLLKYILLNGNDYERIPATSTANNNLLYPSAYFLPRRRRSPTTSTRLQHVQQGKQSERQLARTKRTKRDLFDDDLYYIPGRTDYDPRREQELEQEQEEQEREAADEVEVEEERLQLRELLAYLMALYDSPSQDSRAPSYLWPGGQYPLDDLVPTYSQWEEPTFQEEPAEWELEPQVPSWEGAYYPEEMEKAIEEQEEEEEMEDPRYYPTAAKRQMLSMVPGERRKRYFYPFAREPYAHWGAFVPGQQKRDYGEEYGRLRELAMALAEPPRPSPFLASLDEYKKK